MSFSQTPTPHTRFVANKDQSAIRPNGDRAVEGIFWYFSVVKCGPISVFFFWFYCSVGRGSQALVTDRRLVPVFTSGPQLAANLSRNLTFIRLGGHQFTIFGNSGDPGNSKLLFCEPVKLPLPPPWVSHPIPVWRRFIPPWPRGLYPIGESG